MIMNLFTNFITACNVLFLRKGHYSETVKILTRRVSILLHNFFMLLFFIVILSLLGIFSAFC